MDLETPRRVRTSMANQSIIEKYRQEHKGDENAENVIAEAIGRSRGKVQGELDGLLNEKSRH
jgi:hypothetical protein